jgi:hypothetical protein
VIHEFTDIGDIAYVVSEPVLLNMLSLNPATSQPLNGCDAFQQRCTVLPPTTKVIRFTLARIPSEGFKGENYIPAMDLVPHLFALVAKDGVVARHALLP